MYTVLVADDDPGLRRLVRATLPSRDYDVLEATDGDEAWQLLQEHRPQVALLDIRMPRRSGVALAHAIKTDPDLAQTRVILLTGLSTESARAAGLAAGADWYITKPFSPLELLRTLALALEGPPTNQPLAEPAVVPDRPLEQELAYADDLRQLFEVERDRRRELEAARRELTAAQAELERRVYDLLAVQDWSLATNLSYPLPMLADRMAQSIVLLLRAQTALLFPRNPHTGALGSVLGFGVPADTPPRAPLRTSALTAAIVVTDDLWEIEDLSLADPARTVDVTPARALGWEAMVGRALVMAGQTVGVLYIGWATPHALDERERLLIDIMAQQIALVLTRAIATGTDP